METCTANPLTAEKKTELFKKDKKTHTVWLSGKTEETIKKIQHLKDSFWKTRQFKTNHAWKSLVTKKKTSSKWFRIVELKKLKFNEDQKYIREMNFNKKCAKFNLDKEGQTHSQKSQPFLHRLHKLTLKNNSRIGCHEIIFNRQIRNFANFFFLGKRVFWFGKFSPISNDQFHANSVPHGTRANGRVWRQERRKEKLKT